MCKFTKKELHEYHLPPLSTNRIQCVQCILYKFFRLCKFTISWTWKLLYLLLNVKGNIPIVTQMDYISMILIIEVNTSK